LPAASSLRLLIGGLSRFAEDSSPREGGIALAFGTRALRPSKGVIEGIKRLEKRGFPLFLAHFRPSQMSKELQEISFFLERVYQACEIAF
jgi:hypothetical protein